MCLSIHIRVQDLLDILMDIKCYGNIKNGQVLQFVASMAILKGDILDTQYEYTFI